MKLSTSDRKRFRIKNKVKKVAKLDRFRLSVSRSTKNISAQIIDDRNNKTLFSASSIEKDIKNLILNIKEEKINFDNFVSAKYDLHLQPHRLIYKIVLSIFPQSSESFVAQSGSGSVQSSTQPSGISSAQ